MSATLGRCVGCRVGESDLTSAVAGGQRCVWSIVVRWLLRCCHVLQGVRTTSAREVAAAVVGGDDGVAT